ncbi:hypothetical protein [Sulfurimonas sp.]|uniref:hypothetical protein n=1 Tax=Sulfurimonas sp. TaxID=2022749 RepID=UPI0035612E3C
MRLADKIRFECFCAFVHSRLTSVGTAEDFGVPILNDDDSQVVEGKGERLIKELSSVATMTTINKKIESGQSVMIANMYHNNYSRLLNLMDKKIKKDDEFLSALLGISMMMSYYENDKHEKLLQDKISVDELNSIFSAYEKTSKADKVLVFKMMNIGSYITENYIKKK